MELRKEAPPYAWAAGTALIVLGIYLLTLAPTVAFWDTSEYIAAAKVLGIPHPPGNPLFTVLAHAFGLLPLAGAYAVRINIFAALTSALAAGLFFLVAERWMRAFVEERGARLASSLAGVLVGATMWTVWNQSTVNEKVYTVSLLSMALVLWLAVHWADDEPGPHRDRWVVLIAYVLALTSTNHMMGVLAAPAVGIYVLWTDWRVLTRWRVMAAVLVAAAVGVSLNYLFLPIRSAQLPAINEGEPVCQGLLDAITSCPPLADVLNRVQYGKPSVFERQADFGSQLGNYWQYWSWQFARDWGGFGAIFTGLFTALGLGGLLALWKHDKRAGLAAGAFFFTLVPLLIFYLNFKYGFSMHPEQPDLPREVRERDYFFLCSFAAFGLLVALGLGWTVQAIQRATKQSWLAGAPVLLVALVPLAGNHVTASRAGETVARDFARDILESVEPYGILITAGDNDTFPLWFAQEVEGIRRDVTLANLSLMNTRWHLRQLRRRTPDPFNLATSVPLWGGDGGPGKPGAEPKGGWPRPTVPTFDLDIPALDSLPEVVEAPKNSGVQIGDVQIRLGQGYLQLQDLATIALIKQNLGRRAIYFSWSDGGYPDQVLGLSPYLISQGLVRKLNPTPAVESDSIRLSKTLGFIDVARSRRLITEVYRWQAVAKERPFGWVDPPSSSILQLYAIVFKGTGEVLGEHGDARTAAFADSVYKQVLSGLTPRR